MLLSELTREKAKAIAPRALAVLPVGATEQHGPHLPVGTDHFTVEHVARKAAEQVQAQIPVVVTPTLPFGSSHHHLPFGGTMSFSTETYYRVLWDLCESLVLGGFRRIFILNGHGGNREIIELAARDLALKHPVAAAASSYWVVAWDALVEAGAHVPGRLPGHAGCFETSVMLALRPELVDKNLPHRASATGSDPRSFLTPYRFEIHGSWQAIDGYSDSPDRATAEYGKRWTAAAAGAVAQAYLEFYQRSEGVAK